MKTNLFWAILIFIIVAMVGGMVWVVGSSTDQSAPAMLAVAVGIDDHVSGEGPAELVEYSDFQCPACASYQPAVNQLRAELSDRLTFAYRHFPLTQHKNAIPAAEAAEAAGAQGKFWEMADILFARQHDWAESGRAEELLEQYARELGLDLAQFRIIRDSTEMKERIERNRASGLASKVSWTPTFYVNGNRIANPTNYAEFKNLILAAGSSTPRVR